MINYQDFMEKMKKIEKNELVDLSSDEDLSIAIMNLISIEEHLFFTYEKTSKSQYLDLLDNVRQMRKPLLKKIVKDYEGEVWCISKHLLASSMRLMEVGTKMLGKKEKAAAEDLFHKSFQLYSLFWGINLGMVETKDLKDLKQEKSASASIDKLTLISDKMPSEKKEVNLLGKLSGVVKKILDCCRE